MAISGATGTTFTITTTQEGKTLSAIVTATNASGTGTATSASTVAVPIPASPPAPPPPAPPPPPPGPVGSTITPRAASQVKDMVGICIHQSYPQYAAKPLYAATGNWQQPLLDLNVTHVRGLQGRQASDLLMMQPLFSAGMKLCAPVYAHGNVALTASSYDTAKLNIEYIRDEVGPANMSAIEGLNEYNKNEASIPNWATLSRTFSKFIYDTKQAMPTMVSVKAIPPSVYRRYLSAYQALGDMSAFVDDGCGHYYTGVNMPTQGAVTMDQFVTYSRILTPSSAMKVFVTECGFSNQNGPNKLSKYLTRLMLEFMYRDADIRRAYIFELFDTDPTPLWGLLDANLNKRPHYFAIKNFVALFAGSGTPTLTPLTASVSVASTAKLKYLLHRKPDGSYLLSLWREIVSTETEAAPAAVTVTLGSAPSSLVHNRPALSAAPVSIANSTSFTVQVTDQPSIIKITL